MSNITRNVLQISKYVWYQQSNIIKYVMEMHTGLFMLRSPSLMITWESERLQSGTGQDHPIR